MRFPHSIFQLSLIFFSVRLLNYLRHIALEGKEKAGADAIVYYQHALPLHLVESIGTLRPRRQAIVGEGAIGCCSLCNCWPVSFSYLVNRLSVAASPVISAAA